MREEAVLFGKSGSLVGVITNPPEDQRRPNLPAFVFLNSGTLHRIGSNRLSVKMARELSKLGFVSLRFDFSGIGDSIADNDNLSIKERWIAETQQAMDFLAEKKGVEQFVLAGNCSGAALSFFTALYDPRVIAALFINLQGRKVLLRYYLRLALTTPKIWLRIFKGTSNYKDLITAALALFKPKKNIPKTDEDNSYAENESVRDLIQLLERGTKLCFIYSQFDPGLPYYKAYIKKEVEKYKDNGMIHERIIQGINHDFNLLRGQEDLIRIVYDWALRMLKD